MYKRFIKRFLDIVLSLIAIIILLPVYFIISILVLIFMGWPIIFKQQRPGKNEKIFNMYKFRTMLSPRTLDGKKLTDQERLNCIANNIPVLSDEKRLTKLGLIMRKLSLDELPELFNILKGDMSIVGPRPLVKIYLPYYNDIERHRHDVRPGLTGLAQVNGRNSASWEERFKYDVEYVNNISFSLDVKIIIKTILVVIKGSDIGQGAEKPEAFNVVRQRELDNKKGK